MISHELGIGCYLKGLMVSQRKCGFTCWPLSARRCMLCVGELGRAQAHGGRKNRGHLPLQSPWPNALTASGSQCISCCPLLESSKGTQWSFCTCLEFSLIICPSILCSFSQEYFSYRISIGTWWACGFGIPEGKGFNKILVKNMHRVLLGPGHSGECGGYKISKPCFLLSRSSWCSVDDGAWVDGLSAAVEWHGVWQEPWRGSVNSVGMRGEGGGLSSWGQFSLGFGGQWRVYQIDKKTDQQDRETVVPWED